MAKNPPQLLSVVTPVFNGAEWIGETIESVLAQEGVAIEHIVLDDGSTDATSKVLARFAGRIRHERHANMGESRTVNRGVALASHALVAVVNADDPVLPGWAAAMTEAMAGDAGLAAAYPDWRRIDAEGRTLAVVRTVEFSLEVAFGQHYCIPGPGAVLRPAMLAGEPVRDPARGTSADFDLWLRLALRGPIRRVPRVLATWRQHAGGTSSAGRSRAMAEDKIGTARAFLARPDLPPDIRRMAGQGLSAAYLNAAMLGLRARGVPAWRYAIASFWHCPRWPPGVVRQQRRSLPHLLYAATQPLSAALHRATSPLLPRRLRHAAMLAERFGVADA
jgi:glycosyltransferase involved in cell wall biosynthesis